MRIRTPIVVLVIVLATSIGAAELRLPIANTPSWSTTLFLSLPTSAPSPVHYTNTLCGYGPSGVTASVVPGGAAAFSGVGYAICAGPFISIPAPAVQVKEEQ